MTLQQFDRSEVLRNNPMVDTEQLAKVEATLAELERIGLRSFESHYLLDPALGSSTRTKQLWPTLFNQTTRLGK